MELLPKQEKLKSSIRMQTRGPRWAEVHGDAGADATRAKVISAIPASVGIPAITPSFPTMIFPLTYSLVGTYIADI